MKGEHLYQDSTAQQVTLKLHRSHEPCSDTKYLGCAIVTNEEAFLFTDGRYYLQAEKQLDKSAAYDQFYDRRNNICFSGTGR
jgi:hypothetical protein